MTDVPSTPAPTPPTAGSQAASTAPRRTEYMRLEDLRPDPRNPKSHDLATIDDSYERFGVIDQITLDERTGFIVSGHGRRTTLYEAMSRGDAPPEGVLVDEDGHWLVPVNRGWASKNDAEAGAALIALNRLTEMGGWVDQSLLDLLEEISSSGAGFDGIGYSETDLDDLRHLLEDVPDLDELAEEWNEDDPSASIGAAAVVVKLTDPGLITAWHDARDRVKTDDDAMRILMGLVPMPEDRNPGKRVPDPTVEDLEPVDYDGPTVETEDEPGPAAESGHGGDADGESASLPDLDATLTRLSEGAGPRPELSPDARVIHAAEGAVESPEDDDGLDWSTAGMEPDGDEELTL